MYQDLQSNFEEHEGQIPIKIRDKLKFLKYSIDNHQNDELEVNVNLYPSLDQDEIEALFKLPIESQKSMFCSVFRSLELEEESVINGELHIKGETLGIWRVKKIVLNITMHTLKVARKDDFVTIDLKKYSLMWIGEKKSIATYHCFTIVADNPNDYDHYKHLIMGSDDVKYAKKWFGLISKAFEHRKATRRMSVGDPINRSPLTTQLNKSDEVQVGWITNQIRPSSSDISELQYMNTSTISNINNTHNDNDKIIQNVDTPIVVQNMNTSTKITNEKKNSLINQIHQVIIKEQPELLIVMPEHLRDLNEGMFQIKHKYRIGKNVYRSTLNSNVYQILVQLTHPIDSVNAALQNGIGWNKYIIDQRPFIVDSDYHVVEQQWQIGYFQQPKYILKHKNNGVYYSKELNVSTDTCFYEMIKVQQTSSNVTVLIICQITQPIYLQHYIVPFLEEYNNLQEYLQFELNIKELRLKQQLISNNGVDSSFSDSCVLSKSDSCHSDEFTQTYQQNYEQTLQKVISRKHWESPINVHYQLSPRQTVTHLLESGPDGHFLLKQDWKIDSINGGLIYIDPVGISQQKKVFSYLLSNIGTNIMEGKPIMNISLPVNIFEKRTNLQRIASTLTYIQYLEKSVDLDPKQQIKWVLAFGFASVFLYLKIQKPFNPILGETYQGFINGCPIYAEQVSHHPPVSVLMLVGRGFKVYTRLCTIALMSANSVHGYNQGYTKVVYDNGNEYIFLPCSGIYFGTIYGDKLFQFNGKFHALDLKGKQVAEVKINPNPASIWNKQRSHLDDYFEGRLYNVSDAAVSRYHKDGFMKFKELKQNEILNEGYQIKGIWHKEMYVDKELVWTLDEQPHLLQDEDFPLASDSNFRQDLIAWRMDDFELAMSYKTELEERQRADAKLRQHK